MAALAQRLGHLHYLGISHLNLAWLAHGSGDAPAGLRSARLSLDSLASTSAGPEMDTVRTVAAWAHAHIGDTDAALAAIDDALASPFAQGRFETLLEAADVVGTYIDPDRGATLLAEAEAVGPRTDAERTYLAFFRAETLMRLGLPDDARATARHDPGGPPHRLPGVLRESEARPGPGRLPDRQPRDGEPPGGREGTGGAAGCDGCPPRDPAAREPRSRRRARLLSHRRALVRGARNRHLPRRGGARPARHAGRAGARGRPASRIAPAASLAARAAVGHRGRGAAQPPRSRDHPRPGRREVRRSATPGAEPRAEGGVSGPDCSGATWPGERRTGSGSRTRDG